MRPIISVVVAAILVGLALPALAQQTETGPAKGTDGHPMRTEESGTRGPSGGSPETGYHGPRDVTKDSEPGKAKSAEELRKTGQVPEKAKTNKN